MREEFDTRRVPKKYQDEAKRIHPGLYIVFNRKWSRWQIRHKDPRNGLDRHVITVEDKDGNYEHLNMGVIRLLKDTVVWDLIGKYPDPKDAYQEMIKEHNYRKWKVESERVEAVRYWNRQHKTEWKHAIENAKSGRFDLTEREPERKIIIT